MRRLPYTLLAIAVLVLIVGPIGTAAFVLGFGFGESPCVLCWAQRTMMILVALCGLFVLRYGPRPRYLGLGVLIGAAGIYMGLRHSALHLARDVGQGFSAEILGAHTYTWSMFIFWVCVVVMGALLMLLRDGEATAQQRTPGVLDRLAMPLFVVAVAGNVVQAFASTGPPPFMGQSDPIRFSFNPSHWVWSLEEWAPAPISLRGRWAIEKPSLDGLSPSAADGPLSGAPQLEVSRHVALPAAVPRPITGLAYDAATDRFLVTTSQGIYLTGGDLGQVQRHTVVDPAFSVDLATFSGAAFLDSQTVMALSENKSYVVLKENDGADAAKNFRYFLESFDRFDEVVRGRFTTVRARMMYAMSVAFDPASQSIYTLTVPNARVHRLVVSRFDRRDMTLSEEFVPALAKDGPLRLSGDKRTLDEYYVTGATFAEGRILACSAAYSTLLEIDPATRSVVSAHGMTGIERPVGLASKGDELYIASETGTVFVVPNPGRRTVADNAPPRQD
jgi:disulfide bond formation protein DsbB